MAQSTTYLSDTINDNLGSYDPYSDGYSPPIPGPIIDEDIPSAGDDDYEAFIHETAQWRIDNAEGFLAKAKARLAAFDVDTAGLSKYGIFILIAAGSYLAWKKFKDNS